MSIKTKLHFGFHSFSLYLFLLYLSLSPSLYFSLFLLLSLHFFPTLFCFCYLFSFSNSLTFCLFLSLSLSFSLTPTNTSSPPQAAKTSHTWVNVLQMMVYDEHSSRLLYLYLCMMFSEEEKCLQPQANFQKLRNLRFPIIFVCIKRRNSRTIHTYVCICQREIADLSCRRSRPRWCLIRCSHLAPTPLPRTRIYRPANSLDKTSSAPTKIVDR